MYKPRMVDVTDRKMSVFREGTFNFLVIQEIPIASSAGLLGGGGAAGGVPDALIGQ